MQGAAREETDHRREIDWGSMRKPATIATQHIHSGRIIDVSTERLRYGNGREYDLDFVRHPGAAAVVAVDGAGRVCLVRQYRHGVTDFLWEIPAGKLDVAHFATLVEAKVWIKNPTIKTPPTLQVNPV